MRAVLVIVADIFAQETLQVPFCDHDHMIQQVPAAALHPSLSDSVLPRALERSSLRSAPHYADGSNHFKPEHLVLVKNQVFVRSLERECLAQLLDNPITCWIASHIEMQYATAVVGDEEETVEDSEGDRVHLGIAARIRENVQTIMFERRDAQLCN